MTTAYFLHYEVLEQSTDALRSEIEQKKLNNNGKLERKETDWLNSKPEIFYKGGFDILFKDMVETNKKYLTTDPVVMSVLDGISGSTNWYKQVLAHNAGNKTQLDFINKVGRKYHDAMKVVNATKDMKDRVLKGRVVAMNMLLMLNDFSKKDIGNFAVFSDSTFKAMHQYQKQYKDLRGTQNYSRADCIFGYRTAQQLCKNVGITPRGVKVDEHFDSKKNAVALTIDKQKGFTKKQFVLDGFTLYKNYLVSMHKHMDLKGFTKMDEKLEASITNLDLNIKNISKTKIDDATLDKKVDALITNIQENRSWMQNLYTDSDMAARLTKEDSYMTRFKNLLKNPGNFQSARKDMVAIFSGLDKDALLLNNHGDAYQDMARDEMVNSREIYNNNKKIVTPEHNMNIVEERSVGRALQDIDSLLSASTKGSNDLLIKMYEVTYNNRFDTQGNDNNPKEVSKLIGKLIQEEVDKNPGQYKDLRDYIQTSVNRWDNFMGGNDIKNMVKMIQYNQNHLTARKDALKKDMTQEYNELLRYEARGTLDLDQQPRLDGLKQLMANGGIDENTLASALKASEITMMGNMLKDHMFFRAMDGKTDEYKDIIGNYDNIIGAGKGLSDKYANSAMDTTVFLAREILVMTLSGGLAAIAERVAAAAIVKGAQIFRKIRGVVETGRTAAIVEKSGLSVVEIATVGARNGRMLNNLKETGRLVVEANSTHNRIERVASFLSQGSLITKSSLELASNHTGWLILTKLARYAANGTVFHLSSTFMTNAMDGNDLSENMSLKDFAKSIAFIGILSEISSIFRFALPLNNTKQAAQILETPQAVAGKTINTSSIFKKIGVASAEVTTEVAALLATSRAVSVLFGEKHEDLSPNEIAHTLAIVLGMKSFHGLVTIKDARRGIVENNGTIIDLKTDLTKAKTESQNKTETGEKVDNNLKPENQEKTEANREVEFADPSPTNKTETVDGKQTEKQLSSETPNKEREALERREKRKKANELLSNSEKPTIESKLKEPEKIKNEQEALEVVSALEREIKEEKIPDSQAEATLESLSSWYKGLRESLKNAPGFLEKMLTLIDALVLRITKYKQYQTKIKIEKGEVKIPNNLSKLSVEDRKLAMQANVMQDHLPGYKKIADYLDGGRVGKEWAMGALGYIPVYGWGTIATINAIQASVASWYGIKMGLGGKFHSKNRSLQAIDGGLSTIRGVGLILDVAWKPNRRAYKDMARAYHKVVTDLQKTSVDKDFIDHHVKKYEEISGKKFN